MKKFIKVSAITALVLAVLGLVLFLISAFGGGMKTIRWLAIEDRLNFKGFNWNFVEKNLIDEKYYEISPSLLFDDAYEIQEGTAVFTAKASEIENLNLEIGGYDVHILSHEGDYEVKVSGSGKSQAYVKNGTLYIKALRKFYSSRESEIYLYVPKNAVLNEAELKLGAGQIEAEAINARDIEVEVGAGALYFDFLKADRVKIEVGAGEIIAKNGEMKDLDLSVGAGSLEWKGYISGNINAEVAMGSMRIVVQGSGEKDHNYDVSCAMGSVVVGEREWTGMGAQGSIDNGADTNYNLECAMGELRVSFKN